MAAIDVGLDVWLGTWTNAKPYLRNAATVQIMTGRPDLKSTISPASCTMTLDNRDNRWTIRNPTGPWYGQLVQDSPVRVSVPSSLAGLPCYLRLENDNTSMMSTPDSAPLQITSGTLSVRIDCKITDWISNHVLIAKDGATAQAWALWTNGSGTVEFFIFDGTSQYFGGSPLPLPYFGQRIAIRVDYVIATGVATFYTAPTMSGSWTQLGPPKTLLTTGFSPTSPTTISAGVGQAVQIGAGTTSLPGLFGEVYEAQIYSTASLVADPVFTSQTPGATSFTDGQSNVWTLNGTGELSGRLYRFHGELGALPKAAAPNNAGGYSPAQAGGLMRRLTLRQTPADSAMKRAYVRLPSNLALAAYWPGEDAIGATQIGQAVGKFPMSAAGLTMSTSTVFQSSAALPLMNGATASALVDPSSVTWTDNAVRFLLSVPPGDDTNNAVVCQFTTTGTIALVQVVYGTGGSLRMNCYNAAGGLVAGASIGAQGFGLGVLGKCRVTAEIRANGTTGLFAVTPNTAYYNGAGGTFSGTVGAVTSVSFGGGLINSAMGHFSVQGTWDPLSDLGPALGAWSAETAGARFSRLCGEEGIACRIIGPPDKSQPMGFQTQQTVAALLQECENTDQGFLIEPRFILGLGYVTNWALCNQAVTATGDFAQQHIGPAFSPASDDTLIVNDATATSLDASAARYVLPAGPTSVQPPPAGAGRFDTTVTVNPAYDSALGSLASWYVHARTADEDRYPAIPFQLARGNVPQSVPLLDIGSYMQVVNPPPWVPTGPVKQIIAGYTETLGPQPSWTISFNGVPETPYEVATADNSTLDHCDTGGCILTTPLTSAATSAPVLTTFGPAWTTGVADYPFDLILAGEDVTATAVAAGSTGFSRTGGFLGPFGMGTADFTTALTYWTGTLGLATPAAVRYYLPLSTFTFDTNMHEIVVTAGLKMVLDIRPAAGPLSATDLANLTTLLAALQAAGANVVVSIWAEPFYNGLTIAEYQAAVRYYGPVVRQYFPLACVLSVASVHDNGEAAYYPGDKWVDIIAADFYANVASYGLDTVASIANAANPPKPFGVYEMGASNDPIVGQSSGAISAYVTQVINYFQNRLAVGYANADLLWFNGGGSGFNILLNTQAWAGASAQQAGFEGGNGNWAARAGTGLVNTATQHNTGSDAAQITCTTAGNIGIQLGSLATNAVPVTAGVTYTLAAWFKAATTGRSVIVGVNWYTAGGAFISSSGFGGVTADVTTGWTQASQTCLAPATAAFANLVLEALSAVLTEVHYIDDVVFAAQNSVVTVLGFNNGSSPTSDARVADWTSIRTALDSTSVPQTLTLTRSVNGVVKAQNAGTDVRLAHPMTLAL